ncbi:MAG: rRNA pseudouridine synthase [Rickettsiales bacterium]|jgi:23S rRNA pseudouridine2605 synthase|nr:rRNA pseudouridine synthase [Rickettsiales bacterium]
MIRISKYLSDAGVASRRGAEELIAQGRVAVNGRKIDGPVVFVGDDDKVCVDGKVVRTRIRTRTGTCGGVWLFHKPVGCLCTAKDPEGRRTIYDILPAKYKNLKYIGRLDYNTSGLLLLTDDGALARKMTLPESKIERVYIAKLGRTMTMDDAMVDRLLKPVRKGIKIDGVIYRPMKIERLDAQDFRITLTEGKKNEIRVVFEHIGLPVRALHRVSYGEYELGRLAPAGITLCSAKNKATTK